MKQYVNGLKETLLRGLKDQTGHPRNNIEEDISCRHIKAQKQQNASIVEVKITNQQPAPEFKISTKEERSSPLKNFALTALVKDIVPGNCKSKRSCRKCKGHYTSLCIDATSQQSPTTRTESDNPTIRQELLTTSENEAIYPVAVVKVNCITCRALPDTGAGSSYISSTLRTDYTNSIIRTDYKQIETMLHTTNTLIDIYDVEMTITKCDFTINTEVSKLDRAELTSMPNPHYEDIKTYTHLQ